KKDMIKSGGENVSSLEVEKCIFNHEKVLDVAVVGLPDPRWIEAVTAVVVPRPGVTLTPEEIITHCKAHLAGYKVPKRVLIRDQIPKTATGKTLKYVLRQMLVEELERG
ncbi:MAG: acyl-CoA synthetase, partial [Firmicutes bacterium]|nr:acyl-CoA synthetase [Bacillota bacterium]